MIFTVEILLPPGDLAVNRAWRSTRSGVVKSDMYREARKHFSNEIREAAEGAGWPVFLFSGEVSVRIAAYWPTSQGDVDAPIKGLLDCIQQSGVVGDDRQVCHVSCTRHYDPTNPRVVLTISE